MTPAAHDLATRHDQARATAERLRREAMADFWRGTDTLLATAAAQALRAGRRLACGLRRQVAQTAIKP